MLCTRHKYKSDLTKLELRYCDDDTVINNYVLKKKFEWITTTKHNLKNCPTLSFDFLFLIHFKYLLSDFNAFYFKGQGSDTNYCSVKKYVLKSKFYRQLQKQKNPRWKLIANSEKCNTFKVRKIFKVTNTWSFKKMGLIKLNSANLYTVCLMC